MDSNLENNNVENMTSKEILDLIWKALNKANAKGVFSIDEAFGLKVLYEKLKTKL